MTCALALEIPKGIVIFVILFLKVFRSYNTLFWFRFFSLHIIVFKKQ